MRLQAPSPTLHPSPLSTGTNHLPNPLFPSFGILLARLVTQAEDVRLGNGVDKRRGKMPWATNDDGVQK